MSRLGRIAALAGLLVVAPARAEEGVAVRPIGSATRTAAGQPIRLPQGDARVSMSEFTLAPGARLPVHKHPFPRFAYVLTGTLAVTDQETGRTIVYKPGDMVVEVVDRWHSGANAGPTPVRLLVIDEVAGDVSNTILRNSGAQPPETPKRSPGKADSAQ